MKRRDLGVAPWAEEGSLLASAFLCFDAMSADYGYNRCCND